jgi:GH43 family beta-xylosidase
VNTYLNCKTIDNTIKIANNLQLISIENKFRIKDEKMNVNKPELNKITRKYELLKGRG